MPQPAVRRKTWPELGANPEVVRQVLTGWPSTRLALARDATSLGDRLTVRSIHRVDRGCALAVAWKVLRGHLKHPWKPAWLQWLQEFHGRIPAEGTVIVLSDRGL